MMIKQIANKIYPQIKEYYGVGKLPPPIIEIHKNIYARLSGEPEIEGGDPAEAEYDYKENKIFLYSDFINSTEDIIKGIIHEYIHYLQSESWMKRYYNMGYSYENHPYEISAKKAEDNWEKFA